MEEEEKAREEAEVKELEGALSLAEVWLLGELGDSPGARPPWTSLSPVMQAAVMWLVAKDKVRTASPGRYKSTGRAAWVHKFWCRPWKRWCTSLCSNSSSSSSLHVPVSYLECGHYFYGPLYMPVTCSVLALPEEYRNLYFLGDDSRFWFRIQYFAWSDSGYMSVYVVVWKISLVFYVKMDTGSSSRLFGVWLSPEKYRNCTVWEMTSRGWISVFSVLA